MLKTGQKCVKTSIKRGTLSAILKKPSKGGGIVVIDAMVCSTLMTILKGGVRSYSIEELQERASIMLSQQVKRSDIARVINQNRNRFEILNEAGVIRVKYRF
jgi:uncharacterized phosphosugar-binding protein